MARLEIPSIVVHNGSNSAPGSPTMERSLRAQRTLSKQAEFEELEEDDSVPHMSSPSSSPGAAISTSCHCQGDNSTPSPVSCNQTSNKHKTVEVRDDTQQQQQQRAGLSRTNSLDVEEKSPPPPPRVRV